LSQIHLFRSINENALIMKFKYQKMNSRKQQERQILYFISRSATILKCFDFVTILSENTRAARILAR